MHSLSGLVRQRHYADHTLAYNLILQNWRVQNELRVFSHFLPSTFINHHFIFYPRLKPSTHHILLVFTGLPPGTHHHHHQRISSRRKSYKNFRAAGTPGPSFNSLTPSGFILLAKLFLNLIFCLVSCEASERGLRYAYYIVAYNRVSRMCLFLDRPKQVVVLFFF